MIDDKILSEYLQSRMCWSNKETVPLVIVENILTSQDKKTIKIKHSVKFRKINDINTFPYFNSIECTIFVSDLVSFIRDKNLGNLINI